MSLLHIMMAVGGHCGRHLMTPGVEDIAHQREFYSEVNMPQAFPEETHPAFKVRNTIFKNLSG